MVSRLRALVLLALVAVAASAAGCFEVAPKSGTLKCSNDDMRLCPSNYQCIKDYCYQNPDLGHARDAAASDGGED